MKYLRFPLLGALPLAAAAASIASAQTNQTQDFVVGASDGQQNDEFSSGLSLDGDRMVVGAGRADIGPNAGTANQGIVYVFDYDGTTWVEQVLLRSSDALIGDEFGSAVDVEGDRFIGGARLKDASPSGDEGAAYVFEFDGTTWTESAKLTASDAGPGDLFGSAVLLEGDFAFCSAQLNDAPGTTLGDEGAVYVFQYDGTTWTQTQKLVSSDVAETEEFGSSIGVDGDRLVIGAHQEIEGALVNAGAVYVFEFDGTNWVETAKVVPSARHSQQLFGSAVDVDGDRMLVGASQNDTTGGTTGAGALWVFEFDGTTWNEVTKLEASDAEMDDFMGTSCSLQGDFAVGGAIGEDTVAQDAGAAYLFEFDGTAWNEIAKLTATNGGISDELARQCVVQGDTVLTSSRLAKPLVGSRVGAVYGFDTGLNAAAMHADFIASPRAGQNPLVIQFDDASVGGATSWAWDFGDGFTSSAQSPTHIYYNFGTFDVSLTVTGALGTDSIVKTGLIQADKLMASATVRNGAGTNPLVYQAVTLPVVGDTFTTTIDASGHPSAGLTLVIGYNLPLTGFPTPFGELLVGTEAFGGFFAYGTVVDSMGGIATHNSAAPTDVDFVGIEISTQGVILGGVGPELTNALDLVLGWQ